MKPPEATFQIEGFESFLIEAKPLLELHYGELVLDQERMPPEPDVLFYRFLEGQRQLQVLTARDKGRMVGYLLIFIRPHSHYRAVLCGFEDLFFILPEYRRGRIGSLMLLDGLARLKARNVKKVFFHSKCHKSIGNLFKFHGFSMTDEIWTKWIGD